MATRPKTADTQPEEPAVNPILFNITVLGATYPLALRELSMEETMLVEDAGDGKLFDEIVLEFAVDGHLPARLAVTLAAIAAARVQPLTYAALYEQISKEKRSALKFAYVDPEGDEGLDPTSPSSEPSADSASSGSPS